MFVRPIIKAMQGCDGVGNKLNEGDLVVHCYNAGSTRCFVPAIVRKVGKQKVTIELIITDVSAVNSFSYKDGDTTTVMARNVINMELSGKQFKQHIGLARLRR